MRQTAVLITLITLFSLLLFGCRQEKEEMLATVTAVAQQPTATPSPTIVVTETAVSTATNTPTPTPTFIPFQTVTPSATPNPTPFDPIPADTSTATYRLRLPDPEIILYILRKTTGVQYPSNWDFHRFLEKDIRRAYPTGFPAANVLLEGSEFAPNDPLEHNPDISVLWPLVQAALVQRLNQEPIELTVGEYTRLDQFQFTPYQIDIDGDENPEWLLDVEDLETRGSGIVPLTVDENNLYHLIPNESQPAQRDFYMHNIFIEPPIAEYNLAGNEQNELIWQVSTYCQRCKSISEKLDIFVWDGTQLHLSKQIRVHSLFDHPGSRYDFTDYTGNGRFDIRVIEPQFGNFECQWEKIEIHSWGGNEWQTIVENEEPPDTPECNLWLALTRQFPVDATQRTTVLAKAIDQLPTEDEGLIALGLVHQAMALSANGQPEQANVTLDRVNSLSNQSEFVQLVQQAYTQAEGNPVATCHHLLQQLDAALDSDIGDYLYQSSDMDRSSSLYSFGVNLPSGKPNRWMLCDLQLVSETMLNQINFPANLSPTTVFDEAGLQVEFVQEINLDDDPELEWTGILEPQAGTLVVMDQVGSSWQVKTVPIDEPVLSLETAVRDVTGDGIDDAFSLVSFQFRCIDNLPMFRTVLLDSADTAGTFEGDYMGCAELGEITIDMVSAENFQLVNPPATNPADNIPTNLERRDLETAVFTQTDPSIGSQLETVLAQIPEENRKGWEFEHILFLLGYHYELSGDEAKAVTTYLDLIQQAPSSPWSWLAWARLKPVTK